MLRNQVVQEQSANSNVCKLFYSAMSIGELSFVQMFFCRMVQDQVLEEQSANTNVCQLAKGEGQNFSEPIVHKSNVFWTNVFILYGAGPGFRRAVCKFKCLSIVLMSMGQLPVNQTSFNKMFFYRMARNQVLQEQSANSNVCKLF